MRLLLASANPKKAREVCAVLRDIPAFASCEVLTLADIGYTDDIEENGKTFEENALIKARALQGRGYITIADDSGLEVDALGGAPGIYSARYAGAHGNDAANNALLLKNLLGVPQEKRTARFTCAIACVYPDGHFFTVTAHCEGRILTAPDGQGGFGYDPLFYTDVYGKTLAAITPEEKNAISHRGKALRLFAERFAEEQCSETNRATDGD